MFGLKRCKYCYHKKLYEKPECECRCHEIEREANAFVLLVSGKLPDE